MSGILRDYMNGGREVGDDFLVGGWGGFFQKNSLEALKVDYATFILGGRGEVRRGETDVAI